MTSNFTIFTHNNPHSDTISRTPEPEVLSSRGAVVTRQGKGGIYTGGLRNVEPALGAGAEGRGALIYSAC